MATSGVLTLINALRINPSNFLVRQPTHAISAANYYWMTYDKSTQKTHLPHYRKTKAMVLATLRKKRNYLPNEVVEKHRHSPLQTGTENITQETGVTAPRNYRFVVPEFMPNPDWERRDKLFEKLERQDMLRRRSVMNIPEFYVGSIMAVTVADSFSTDKKNRFVGICIDRGQYGLRAYTVLRNVVEGLGVEVVYELYDPKILSIEVLKLEKRVDDELYYLRDALPEYSTFDFNMQPVILPRGAEVPVNFLKVKMKGTREWEKRWEQYHFEGMESIDDIVNEKRWKRAARNKQPWKVKDLMFDYRGKVPEEEEEEVMAEVFKANQAIDSQKKISRMVIKKKKKST